LESITTLENGRNSNLEKLRIKHLQSLMLGPVVRIISLIRMGAFLKRTLLKAGTMNPFDNIFHNLRNKNNFK
jgi:hypothetical protein